MATMVALFIAMAISLLCSAALGFGPIPHQDFCVADLTSTVRINGYVCKETEKVTVDDFFFSGLDKAGNTSNLLGSSVTLASVKEIPGLYSQGILLGRADYAPNGFNPPHIHTRATEIVTVLEGTLVAGFVASYPSFRHYNKTLNKGDVFVIPHGLIHYLYNIGKGNAVALFAFNSYEAGINLVTYNVFGAKPEIDSDYLARAFQLDLKTIKELQAKF